MEGSCSQTFLLHMSIIQLRRNLRSMIVSICSIGEYIRASGPGTRSPGRCSWNPQPAILLYRTFDTDPLDLAMQTGELLSQRTHRLTRARFCVDDRKIGIWWLLICTSARIVEHRSTLKVNRSSPGREDYASESMLHAVLGVSGTWNSSRLGY